MVDQTFFETYGETLAENYERYFVPYIAGPLARDLIDAADLQPGERVLDVACGTGIVSRMAAERVGQTGSVDGLDLIPGMLEVARRVTQTDPPITWHLSRAESIPLPDESFDAVLCQLGLHVMEDKSAALGEMYRVLAPGGHLALNVSGPAPEPLVILADALSRHISPELAAFIHVTFSLSDPAALEQLLSDAGFGHVSVDTYTPRLHVSPPQEFLWQFLNSSPLAVAIGQADEESRAALEQDVVSGWQPFVEDGAMTISPRTLLTTARK